MHGVTQNQELKRSRNRWLQAKTAQQVGPRGLLISTAARIAAVQTLLAGARLPGHTGQMITPLRENPVTRPVSSRIYQ